MRSGFEDGYGLVQFAAPLSGAAGAIATGGIGHRAGRDVAGDAGRFCPLRGQWRDARSKLRSGDSPERNNLLAKHNAGAISVSQVDRKSFWTMLRSLSLTQHGPALYLVV